MKKVLQTMLADLRLIADDLSTDVHFIESVSVITDDIEAVGITKIIFHNDLLMLYFAGKDTSTSTWMTLPQEDLRAYEITFTEGNEVHTPVSAMKLLRGETK